MSAANSVKQNEKLLNMSPKQQEEDYLTLPKGDINQDSQLQKRHKL